MTDEVLTSFLQEHPDKFRTQAQFSLQQGHINPDKREDLAIDAKTLLAKFNGGAAPESLGDPTWLATRYGLATNQYTRVW